MTAPIPPVDLDQLAAAMAEVVGPWEVLPDEGIFEHHPDMFGTMVTTLDDLPPDRAAVIVAAVNATPALIAELRDLRARVAAAEDLAALWQRSDGSWPYFGDVLRRTLERPS